MNHLRQTLVIDPLAQWRLRRESIGSLPTLPVDEASQAILVAERDALLARSGAR